MFHERHIYMQEAGDPGDAAGGSVTATPDQTETLVSNPAEGANTPEVAAELAALKAEVEALTKAKADAEAVAEAERQAKLTEAEKLAEERVAFTTEIEEAKANIRKEARAQTLDKMGVLSAYRQWAPDVDPRTSEGAAELESWAKDHPEVVKSSPNSPQPFEPAPKSKLAQVLSGAVKSPYIRPEGLRKLLN